MTVSPPDVAEALKPNLDAAGNSPGGSLHREGRQNLRALGDDARLIRRGPSRLRTAARDTSPPSGAAARLTRARARPRLAPLRRQRLHGAREIAQGPAHRERLQGLLDLPGLLVSFTRLSWLLASSRRRRGRPCSSRALPHHQLVLGVELCERRRRALPRARAHRRGSSAAPRWPKSAACTRWRSSRSRGRRGARIRWPACASRSPSGPSCRRPAARLARRAGHDAVAPRADGPSSDARDLSPSCCCCSTRRFSFSLALLAREHHDAGIRIGFVREAFTLFALGRRLQRRASASRRPFRVEPPPGDAVLERISRRRRGDDRV